MCYAKPGPRCVGHTRPLKDAAYEKLLRAREVNDAHPSEQNARAIEIANDKFQTAYRHYEEARAVSPERIKSLRSDAADALRTGDTEKGVSLYKEADEAEQKREDMIRQSKEANAPKPIETHQADGTVRTEWSFEEVASLSHSSSDPEVLRSISWWATANGFTYLRTPLANNTHTPPDTLAILAAEGDAYTAAVLAQNPSTPENVMLHLARNKDTALRVLNSPVASEAARREAFECYWDRGYDIHGRDFDGNPVLATG